MTIRRARLMAGLAGLAILMLAITGFLHHERAAQALSERRSGAYSNILPADYVGPDACGACHREKYALWRTHPRSRMNANAGEQTILGDFSGKTIEYDGGTVVFDRVDGRYTMTLSRAGESHRFVVTRTIGSRFQQMYIGVLKEGPPSVDRLIRAAVEVKRLAPMGARLSARPRCPSSSRC